MIYRLFIALCVFFMGCSTQRVKYEKISISPKFLSEIIPITNTLKIHDVNQDDNQDVVIKQDSSLYFLYTDYKNRKMKNDYIYFEEKIVAFFENDNFIIVLGENNVYFLDLVLNTKQIIATNPQLNEEKNKLTKCVFFSKKSKDFVLLYQDELSWSGDVYFWDQKTFLLQDTIEFKNKILPPQLHILPGRQIVAHFFDTTSYYHLKDSRYSLYKTVASSKDLKQTIQADLNRNTLMDEVYFYADKQEILLSIDKKKHSLIAPCDSRASIDIVDINKDNWLDILSLCIWNKSPSIQEYIFSGSVSIDFVIYEFKNKQGSFDRTSNKKHFHTIHFPANKKNSLEEIVYCDDIDNDGFLDAIVQRKEKLYFYYDIVPEIRSKPSYVRKMWQKLYQKSYLSHLLSFNRAPDTIVSLPPVEGILQKIFVLKNQYFHDIIALQFDKYAIFLFPF